LDHTSLIENSKRKIFTDITLYDFKSVRLLEERDQLKGRLDKLDDFTESEKFDKINPIQQGLMLSQLVYMGDYLYCLNERIKHLDIEYR